MRLFVFGEFEKMDTQKGKNGKAKDRANGVSTSTTISQIKNKILKFAKAGKLETRYFEIKYQCAEST